MITHLDYLFYYTFLLLLFSTFSSLYNTHVRAQKHNPEDLMQLRSLMTNQLGPLAELS